MGHYSAIKRNQRLIHEQLACIWKELCWVKKASPEKDGMLYDSIYIAFLKRQREMEKRFVVREMENRYGTREGRRCGLKGQRPEPCGDGDGCTSVNMLVVISCLGFGSGYYQGQVGERYKRLLCILCYHCMGSTIIPQWKVRCQKSEGLKALR